MLTVRLTLKEDDELCTQKQALLEQSALTTSVSFPSSSHDSIAVGIDRLLQAERILQLNEEELYFVEGGASGPFSPRNELEALYRLHQLLTCSSDPLPHTTNQPVDPEPNHQPVNPKSISQPMNHKTSNQPLHRKTIDQLTILETINQALHPKTIDQPATPETGNQQIDTQIPNHESEEVRKAAIAEVEQRLIAYGADEEPAEKAERCSGVAEQELERWAAENGVVSRVEAAVFKSTGRGAAATTDIGVGETVLEVPEAMLMSASTAMASDMADAFSQVPALDEDTAALLWSMRERHVSTSHWAPFFRSLPAAFGTGLSFGPAAMRELEGTPAYEGLIAAQEHLKSQYAALFPALTDAFPTIFPARFYTWAAFLWAAELWYSYGLKVQFPDGRVRTALVPLVSLLNHAVRPHVTHFSRLDPQTRTLRLPASRPCSAGQQCFLSYGAVQSTDLLTFYGFTVENNPYDAVQMDLELPDDDLRPAKQALLSALGLGLSHFLKAERLPSKLHGALRVLLMDEEEIEGYKGDPRKDKVSDQNEAAIADVILATVDALLAAGQRSEGEADENEKAENEVGGQIESASVNIGIGREVLDRDQVSRGEEDKGEEGRRAVDDGRDVAVAARYRQEQNDFLVCIRSHYLSISAG